MTTTKRPRFQILETYSTGRSNGRGSLERVQVHEDADPYVLRRIPFETWPGKTERSRFLEDIEFLSNKPPVSSPRIRNYWIEEREVLILRRFIEGIPLSQVYESFATLGTDTILAIVSDVIGSLREAHSMGVAHGALRLPNLILAPNGKVWTTDFAMPLPAAAFSKNPPDALFDLVSDLSPEQLAQSEVDERSDIFSLGVVLHSLGALEKPFVGSNFQELRKHILSGPPLELREESGVDFRLKSIVARCLAKRPQDRYQTVDAIEREMGSTRGPSDYSITPTRFQEIAVRCGLEGVFPIPVDRRTCQPTPPKRPAPPEVPAKPSEPVAPTEPTAPPSVPKETPPPRPTPTAPVAPLKASEAIAPEAARIPSPPEEARPEDLVEKYIRAWNQKAFLVEYECFKEGFLGIPSSDYVQRRMATYLRLTRGGKDRVTQNVTQFPLIRKLPGKATVLCVRKLQFPRRSEIFVDSFRLEKSDGEWRIVMVKSTPTSEREVSRTIHMEMMMWDQ